MPHPHDQTQCVSELTDFHYDRLDLQAPTSIRVVYVSPNTDSGLIECSLRHTDLSSGYVALSYVWGPPDKDHKILVNGKPHLVRNNLYRFLAYARTDCHDKPLWIDAICINQQDVNEKNHQIQMMSNIYSNAKAVIAWLGLSDLHPIHTETLIHDLESVARHNGKFDTMLPEVTCNFGFWHSLDILLHADYWQRGWTLQEFMLPHKGFLVCNEDWISVEKLVRALALLKGYILAWGDGLVPPQESWERRLLRLAFSPGWSTVEKHRSEQDVSETS